MDLRTFIRETLCQISDGMIEAQEALRDKGVQINPPHRNNGGNFTAQEASDSSAPTLQSIDFDIALTALDTKKKGANMSIAVMVATIKGEGTKEEVNSSVSRVRFQVVVHLPQYTSVHKKSTCLTRDYL